MPSPQPLVRVRECTQVPTEKLVNAACCMPAGLVQSVPSLQKPATHECAGTQKEQGLQFDGLSLRLAGLPRSVQTPLLPPLPSTMRTFPSLFHYHAPSV